MISRINKLLAAILLVSAALYVVALNSGSITISLSPNWQFSATAGVVFLGIFCLGILTATSVAIVFGVRAYFRERKLRLAEKQRQAQHEQYARARAAAAAGEWEKARHAFEQLVKKDPENSILRVELARALCALGDQQEALRVLEEARKNDQQNVELLFCVADLHRLQGNKTAAIDNLALILQHGPNRRAAALARDLSEELGRYEEARAFHQQVEESLAPSDELRAIRARIELRRLLAETQLSKEQQLQELRAFCRRYSEFVPGLQQLAVVEADLHQYEESAQTLVRAAKASKSSALWNSVSQFWLERGLPERALAAARSATKETSGEARLIAELELARIYISLHMFEEARRCLDEYAALSKQFASSYTSDINARYLSLQGLYLSQQGKHQEAAQVWRELAGVNASTEPRAPSVTPVRATLISEKAPEARLSTP